MLQSSNTSCLINNITSNQNVSFRVILYKAIVCFLSTTHHYLEAIHPVTKPLVPSFAPRPT